MILSYLLTLASTPAVPDSDVPDPGLEALDISSSGTALDGLPNVHEELMVANGLTDESSSEGEQVLDPNSVQISDTSLTESQQCTPQNNPLPDKLRPRKPSWHSTGNRCVWHTDEIETEPAPNVQNPPNSNEQAAPGPSSYRRPDTGNPNLKEEYDYELCPPERYGFSNVPVCTKRIPASTRLINIRIKLPRCQLSTS